ncbi:MAG: NAD(+) synthase [Terriglobia bacterium]
MTGPLSLAHLELDAPAEIERLAKVIRDQVSQQLKRRGAVLGISGGIDSSVAAALCVRALGPKRVVGLLMPEADSSPDSSRLGRLLADSLGIETVLEDITPILKGARCYERRDEAIRSVIPQYDATYKCKIVLPSLAERSGYALFSVVVESPTGIQTKARLTAEAYREIVAATSFKQRTRKMMEYYHADRLQYAVAGTPNRLEYDQGFFVKNGDGAADLKPIAHLYKRQVYQLAAALNVPDEIQRRPPTTDTYSLEQSQEEFYFSLPLDKFDVCLFGLDHNASTEQVAEGIGLTEELVTRVYGQIESKRMATRYLHLTPLLAGEER